MRTLAIVMGIIAMTCTIFVSCGNDYDEDITPQPVQRTLEPADGTTSQEGVAAPGVQLPDSISGVGGDDDEDMKLKYTIPDSTQTDGGGTSHRDFTITY